jgi:hypothetical protein
MKKKLYIFSYTLAFVAENVDDAEKQLQEDLNNWVDSTQDASNWEVEESEVEISEI